MRKVLLVAAVAALALTIPTLAGAEPNPHAASFISPATAGSLLKSGINKQLKFAGDRFRMTSARCMQVTPTRLFCVTTFSDGHKGSYGFRTHLDGSWEAHVLGY